MIRAARHLLFLTSTFVLLNGCGLKGPLYLPEERARQQAESEQQKKARATSTPTSRSGSSSTAPVVPTDSPAPATTSPPED